MSNVSPQPFGHMGRPFPAYSTASCIFKPAIANTFEVRSHLVRLIERKQFRSSPLKSLPDHLSDLLEKCDTININNVYKDAVRLRLFPFRVREKVKT